MLLPMKKNILLLILISFVIGIFSGLGIHKLFKKPKSNQFTVIRKTGYKYTSPLLYLDVPQNNTDFVKKLNSDLLSYVKDAFLKGLAQNVSIYLRFPQLPDWTEINGDQLYSPASLLKVPVMMLYFKQSEFNPTILSKNLKYDIENDNQKTNYKPKEEMVKGKSYPISDLIRRMIVYSDNTAEDILTMNVNKQDFDQVFDDMQIDRFNYDHQENSMDVKTYSYFFRVLYNSTFLNRNISDQALKLLTQTTFTKGIVGGVPKGIDVAHKFGERYFLDSGSTQLHDCGIVYFPRSPYVLCVMTRGNSFANLEKVLREISKITYDSTLAESKKNNEQK